MPPLEAEPPWAKLKALPAHCSTSRLLGCCRPLLLVPTPPVPVPCMQDGVSFHGTRDKLLPRPWVIDDLDPLLQRLCRWVGVSRVVCCWLVWLLGCGSCFTALWKQTGSAHARAGGGKKRR